MKTYLLSLSRFKDFLLNISSFTLIHILVSALILTQCELAFAAMVIPDHGVIGDSVHIDKAANGVPVVNINEPNAAGISHNHFQEFNVGNRGIIINNSMKDMVSDLGGIVHANSNLNHNANTIINEVTSTSPSYIAGTTELLGNKADYILANPNGITVNGGDFINVHKAILTTARPELDHSGNLKELMVTGGNVTIEGEALDLTDLDYFGIISHTARIYAKIHGGHEIEIQTANQKGETSPSIAIDSSHLGGLYAGKIKVVANNKGAGVNLPDINAKTDSVTIDSDGNITHSNITARDKVQLTSNAGQINSHSTTLTAHSIKLSSHGSIDETANINSDTTIDLISNHGSVTNRGNITAKGNVIIAAADTIDNRATIITPNDVTLYSARNITQSGTIKSTQTSLKASRGAIHNSGLLASKTLTKLDAQGNIINDGAISSLHTVDVTSSEGSVSNKGAIAAIHKVDLAANTDLASGGNINAEDVTITSSHGSVALRGQVQAQGALYISAGEDIDNSAITTASNVEVIASRDLTNSGTIRSSNALTLNTGRSIVNSGTLYACGILRADADYDITNEGSWVAENDLFLDAHSIINQIAGNITSLQHLELLADGNLTNHGEIVSRSTNIDLHSNFYNSNLLKAEHGSLILKSRGFHNSGRVASQGDSSYTITGNWSNHGTVISAQDITINAQEVSNHNNGSIDAAKTITINAANIKLHNSDPARFLDSSILARSGNIVLNSQQAIELTSTHIEAGGVVHFIADSGDIVNRKGKVIAGRILYLDTDGVVLNHGEYYAMQDIMIKGVNNAGIARLDNHGIISATRSADITLMGDSSNTGLIQSKAGLKWVQHNGQIANHGIILSDNIIDITAPQLYNAAGAEIVASHDATFNIVALDNHGRISSKTANIVITGNDLSNHATITAAQDATIDTLGAFKNIGATTQIVAFNDLTLHAKEFTNSGRTEAHHHLTMELTDDSSNDGTIVAGQDITFTAPSWVNIGHIQANQHLDMAATSGAIENRGNIIAAKEGTITAQTDIINSGEITIHHGKIEAQSGKIASRSLITSSADLTLKAGTEITNARGAEIDVATITFKPGAGYNLVNDGGIHSTASMTAKNLNTLINRNLIEARTFTITGNLIDNSVGATIQGKTLNSTSKKIDNKGIIHFTAAGTITVDDFNSHVMTLGSGSNVRINNAFVNTKEVHAPDATLTLEAHSIDNRGKIKAGHLTLNSDTSFRNSGVVFATYDMQVTAPSSFSNSGNIVGRTLHVNTSGAAANSGGMFGQGIRINASSLDNTGNILSSGNIDITAPISNRAGEISAQGSITLNGGLDNRARIISILDLTVNAGGSNIYNSGNLTAHRNMSLHSSSLNNSNVLQAVSALRSNQTGTVENIHSIFGGRVEITATGGVTNKSHIISSGNLTLSSSSDVVNDGGQISALGDGATLKIRARNLKNSRPYTINRIDPSRFNFHRMPATRQWYHSGPSGEYTWVEAYPRAATIGPNTSPEYFTNPAYDIYNGVNIITTTDHQYNEVIAVDDSRHPTISSGGKLEMHVTGLINNIAGNITAKNDIKIDGVSLSNKDITARQFTIHKTHIKQRCDVINSRKTTTYHKIFHDGAILPPVEIARTPSIIKAGGAISGSLSGSVTIGSSESGEHKTDVAAPSAAIGEEATRSSRSGPAVAAAATPAARYTATIPRATSHAMLTTSASSTAFADPTLPHRVRQATISAPRLQQLVSSAANRAAPSMPGAAPLSSHLVSLTNLDSEVAVAINAVKASVTHPSKPGRRYIKETSPVFTEFEQYFSTQNFIQRLPSYNPDAEPVHYGDAFEQMQIVQQQLVDLTGIATLDESDPIATMQKLYESGERLGRDLELEPGITLSEALVDQLQDDIVWPEIVNVAGEDVLVPRLYLAKNKNHTKATSGIHATNIALMAGAIDNHTAISAASSIALTATNGDVRNLGGSISSGGSMLIVANDDIINEHGSITAVGDAILISGGDIVNTHGAISAAGNLGLSGRNIVNQTQATTAIADSRNYSTTMNGPKSRIKAGKMLALSSREDILNRASNIEAGSLAVRTGGDFTADSVALESASHHGSGSNMSRSYTRGYATSSIDVAGDVVAQVAGDFTLRGSRLNSGGNVNLLTRNLNLESQVATSEVERSWTSGSSGWFKSKKTHHTSSKHDHVVTAGISAGGSLEADSSHMQRFAGATIHAGKKLKLKTAHLQDQAVGVDNQESYSKSKSSSLWRSQKASGSAATSYNPTTIESAELVVDINSASVEVVDNTPTRLAKAVEAAAQDVSIHNTQTQRHSFRTHSHGLSPAAGAVVSLAGGALTAWAGGFGGAVGTMSMKAIAITALEAGATSLGGRAAVLLVNNDLNIAKASRDVTSKQALRGALRSAATAGIGYAISDATSLGKVTSDMSSAQRVLSVASHAAVQSGVSSVVYNQDLGAAAMGAATSGGLAAAQFGVGEFAAAHNIADGTVTKAAMHAAVGSSFGALSSGGGAGGGAGALAGATGAAASELSSPLLGKSGHSVKVAGVVGGASALLLGGDESAVSTASSVASSAHQYNRRMHPDEQRLLEKFTKGMSDEEKHRYVLASKAMAHADSGVEMSDPGQAQLARDVKQGNLYQHEQAQLQAYAAAQGNPDAFSYSTVMDGASDYVSSHHELVHRGVGAAKLAAGSFGVASNAVGAITTAPTLVGGAVFAAGTALSYDLAASGSEKLLGSYIPQEAAAVERSFHSPTQSYAKEQGTILAVEAATTLATTVVGMGANKVASRAVAKHRARTAVRAAPKTTPAAAPAQPKTVHFQKEAQKQQGMSIKRSKNNRITGVKYTQKHHIVHQKLGDHELFEKAGKHVDMPGNKILLPTTKGTQYTSTTRSVHQGRHTKDIERGLERKMDKALIQGKREGWSQKQYAEKLRKIIREERAQLKSGSRTLNAAKDHRITGE